MQTPAPTLAPTLALAALLSLGLSLAGCHGGDDDDPPPPDDGTPVTPEPPVDTDPPVDPPVEPPAGPPADPVARFPTVIDPEADDGVTRASAAFTLDGEALDGRWLEDVDGDARPDFAFDTVLAALGPCPTAVVVPSSLIDRTALTAADLDSTLRVFDSGVPAPDAEDTVCRARGPLEPVGDVDGDGLTDLAAFIDGPRELAEAAVVFGTAEPTAVDAASLDGRVGFTIENVRYGIDVLGDLDGDGFDDIGVENSGWFELPRWRALPGAPELPARRASIDVPTGETLIELGFASARTGAGDVDGDGFDDVLLHDRASFAPAIAYGGAALALRAETVAELPVGDFVHYCRSGFCAAAPAGDVDADGRADVLVSRFSCGYARYVAVLYGGPDGIVPRADLADYPAGTERTRLFAAPGEECLPGGTLRAAGDVDGDGASDLLVTPGRNEYRTALVFGTPGERPPIRALVASGQRDAALVGGDPDALHSRDLDGDGRDDLVFANGRTFDGRARPAEPYRLRMVQVGTALDLAWNDAPIDGVAGYRVGVDGATAIELDAPATSAAFDDPADGAGGTVRLEALDADGRVLADATLELPPLPTDVAARDPLVATATGPASVLLVYGQPRIGPYLRYVVWRDGEPLALTELYADRFVDAAAEPGAAHRYFITPDYLASDTLDAAERAAWPALQRRSETVEIALPPDDSSASPVGRDTYR